MVTRKQAWANAHIVSWSAGEFQHLYESMAGTVVIDRWETENIAASQREL